MEFERYDKKEISWLAETRSETRKKIVTQTSVSIRAPVFDSAGIPVPGEENIFAADLLDFSRGGISILSGSFLPKNSLVRAGCTSKEICFEYSQAKVVYVNMLPNGLRIGLQFTKPINIIS